MDFVKLKCDARDYVCQEPSSPWFLSLLSLTVAASRPASLEPFVTKGSIYTAALLPLADMTTGSKEAERGMNCQAEEGQIP